MTSDSPLTVTVEDLTFKARWEADAPKTVAALRGLLPLKGLLVHSLWSGETMWVAVPAFPQVGYENRTRHPLPGEMHIYGADISDPEMTITYGWCLISSRFGPLAMNHVATITEGRELLSELGRRVLHEGSRESTLEEHPLEERDVR